MFAHGNSLFLLQLALVLVTSVNLVVTEVGYNNYCATANYGDRHGLPVPLQPTTVQAGVRDARVAVDAGMACAPSKHPVGVSIIVCDYDVSPAVSLPNLYTGYVHRSGNLQILATVDTTVYCSY
ncbi:uncharacterized protein LOC116412795 [Galleria mellonella]|uniref:Uncharacterized protein LOC116412795 n=1 Tax=Galleria mellonella TaxID=7137 RepID=A0A6J3BTZ4_GALME|nr:uncharacterized protein LOC116412795 [Galleria mellonella]